MRGFVIAGIAAVISLLPLTAQSSDSGAASAPSARELVWHDEFEGSAIDPSSWTFDLGGGGWGNGEAERYTNRSENARIENGNLVIEARQEKYLGSYYTSARLKTQGLRAFKYGRVEARIKVPGGKGMWPAFWLLGQDIGSVGWPACGEIDAMEYIGKDPTGVHGTVHGPGYSGAQGLTKRLDAGLELANDFHVYAIEWDANGIRWYFDGKEYHSVAKPDVGGNAWAFDKSFFIILNLAVGGGWPGPVALDTPFPARMLVDYVRVYAQEP
jgi:beta-glucanase (GH16 family)